jgi:DNA repair protein RadC
MAMHELDAWSTRDLLAAVLRGPRAHDVADALLREYDLERLSRARVEQLIWTPGVGIARAAAVVASFCLARGAECDPRTVTLNGPADIARASRRHLLFRNTEYVLLLVANARRRVIHTEVVSFGSASVALFPLPEMLGTVLRRDGRAFAVAHNHTCGDPSPTDLDREETKAMARAAEGIGLRFLGHVVVTGDRWCEVEL